jgi:hypothetical protein
MKGPFSGGSMFPGGVPSPGRAVPSPGRAVPSPGRAVPSPGRAVPSPGRAVPSPGVVTTPGLKTAPVRTGRIKADWADPTKPGIVDVHKIKLDSKVRPVVIARARAVQIGRFERQVNKYRYQMVRPTASLDSLLRGHPVRQRALAGLVANPNSKLANFAFRQLLPTRSSIACGSPRFAETSGPRVTKIAARADGQGLFEVTGSQGVQIGVLGAQHNDFRFRVVRPELSLAHALRNRPDLTQTLATALGNPGNQAVRHSLENRLAGAYARLGGLVNEIRGQFDGGGLSVTDAYAVQIGKYNSRVDKVALDVRKVVLTGWGSAGKLGLEQPGKGPEPGLLRHELDHRQRAGLAGRNTSVSHVGLSGADALNMIVRPALHTMATVGISTFAPGRQHLVPGLAADLSGALDTITPFERHADLALKAPVLLHHGMFSLATRPALSDNLSSDETFRVSLSVEWSRPDWTETGLGTDRAPVFLVDAQTEQAAVHPGYQATDIVGESDITGGWHSSPDGGRSAGQQPALPAAGPQPLRATTGSTDATQVPVAVVILGSALLIAAGRRVLEADTLVRFAREVILREIHNGSPASAVLAMRLASALEIVVLLDVALNGGIWIDVNPGTGEPAATLLIDGFPGLPDGTMRFLHSSQQVGSATEPD